MLSTSLVLAASWLFRVWRNLIDLWIAFVCPDAGLKVCRYAPVLRTGTSEKSLRQYRHFCHGWKYAGTHRHWHGGRCWVGHGPTKILVGWACTMHLAPPIFVQECDMFSLNIITRNDEKCCIWVYRSETRSTSWGVAGWVRVVEWLNHSTVVQILVPPRSVGQWWNYFKHLPLWVYPVFDMRACSLFQFVLSYGVLW